MVTRISASTVHGLATIVHTHFEEKKNLLFRGLFAHFVFIQ